MAWTRVLSKADERDFSLKISAALQCEGLAARHGQRNNQPRPQGEAHPTYPSAACAHSQSTFQCGVSRTKRFFIIIIIGSILNSPFGFVKQRRREAIQQEEAGQCGGRGCRSKTRRGPVISQLFLWHHSSCTTYPVSERGRGGEEGGRQAGRE